MSSEEMRSFCSSVSPYALRVSVRLKDGTPTLFGKIVVVKPDGFELLTDENEQVSLRYAWVARLKNA